MLAGHHERADQVGMGRRAVLAVGPDRHVERCVAGREHGCVVDELAERGRIAEPGGGLVDTSPTLTDGCCERTDVSDKRKVEQP